MAKEPVFFLAKEENENDVRFAKKIEDAILNRDLFSFIKPRDFVAIKTHFGESGSDGFVRPVYLKMLGELAKKKQGFPFLTETSTLYRGERSNAVDHIRLAYAHGFGFEQMNLPIIMSDGLIGDEEIEVDTRGKMFNKVGIARLLVKSQALVLVSHFTGHMVAGFGAALKNMGMGCASRKGKLIQHSTAKPSIKDSKCTGCGECVTWCPQDAISLIDDIARIDRKKCIGCGECLATCRFDAVGYNWSETYENLQKKMVEHALGVRESKKGKIICINFLIRITKDCDCMKGFNRVAPDIGVLLSFDPVAIDSASIDLVEKTVGKKWSQATFNIPYRVQIEYGAEIGLGNSAYDLVKIG
jgi:uncharacterized Fe-S center protein